MCEISESQRTGEHPCSVICVMGGELAERVVQLGRSRTSFKSPKGQALARVSHDGGRF
jgi:hypothetical protein